MLLKPSEVWYARNAVTVRMKEAADRKEREKLCTNTFPFEKSVVLGCAGNQHEEVLRTGLIATAGLIRGAG